MENNAPCTSFPCNGQSSRLGLRARSRPAGDACLRDSCLAGSLVPECPQAAWCPNAQLRCCISACRSGVHVSDRQGADGNLEPHIMPLQTDLMRQYATTFNVTSSWYVAGIYACVGEIHILWPACAVWAGMDGASIYLLCICCLHACVIWSHLAPHQPERRDSVSMATS